MKLVDSHCHLFALKDYEIAQDIFPVVAGYSHTSNMKAVAVATGRYPFILGIAPQTAIKEGTKNLGEWIGFIRENRPNAIGEVGLDYKWATNREDVEKEMEVFQAMISLSDELGLPLVIHSRNNPERNEVPVNAVRDILDLVGKRRVLMHFFSGTPEEAEEVVSNGGYISVTHLHSKQRRKVINNTPMDKILVESDCPYVGRTPESIREAVQYIAEIKGIGMEDAGKATSENAMRFFGFRI